MDPCIKRIGDVIIERVGSEKKSKDEDPSTTMNTDTDSLSDSQSSDDELIPDPPTTTDLDTLTLPSSPADQSCDPSTSYSAKRKNDFTDVDASHSKKTKTKYNDEESGSTTDAASGSGMGNAATQDAALVNSESDVQTENSVNLDAVLDKSDLLGAPSELKSELLARTRFHSDNEDSEYDSEEESDGEDASATSKLDPVTSVLDTEKTDFIEKLASELGESSSQKSEDTKLDGSDYDYDITEKLKEMGEISVETVKKGDKPRKSDATDSAENEISVTPAKRDSGSDSDDKNSSERKIGNMRRNIREVMDETQLDEATLAAQRQEMERLRRVQEQQKIIREVQRQIALNRQNNKTQHRVISLLQGNSSIIKQMPGTSGTTANRIGGTVLVKLPNGETKPMTRITKGQTPFEVVRLQKGALQGKVQRNLIPMKKAASGNLTPSVSIAPVTKKIEPKSGDTDSETETSDAEKIVKKVAGKPKDVVTISSSSDDDCIVLSEDEPEEPEPDEDPCNSGMHTNDSYNVPDEQGRVLINVGHPENETDIHLAPQIARVIKPHQIGGVRFLFDNVIESTDRFSTSTGFGCILAHSMGLGKTLQVVCFSDIFLRHTAAKTILCIMPINTLQNWMAEYNMWLPKEPTSSPLLSHGEVRPRNFNLYVLNDSHKTLAARAKVIQEWHKDGGVLLIGYELYRLLSLRRNPKPKSKRKKMTATLVEKPDTPEVDDKNKSLFEEIHEALVKPGPDLVICDEGHRIKNSHASISQALKQIRSKRRIVLTGYPLQNNLLEYWCMVDFVRPNYLGTKTEFSNMFERPIQNGQCIDSTPQDIRLMRYRAHVLHSLLEGFVQRRSHAVLQTSLPQKEEYVLLVRMTEFQRKLYDTFMNEVVRTKTVPNPLKAFAVCCKIWNHPDVLYYFLKKHTQGEAVDIDLEEVAGTASTTAAANGSTGPTPATPKKGSSRSRGGAKKEKKTAASKSSNATTASPNNAKPAASVTPNTNAPTSLTNAPVQPNTPNLPNQLNIPNPGHPNQPMANPGGLQNPPNYAQPNPGYPGPPYPNQHMPYPHQNYPQYPQNGDYYNQNQAYPNNYNPGYYPNQEYGGFYDNKPEGYPQTYQHDNQNYWQHNNPQPGNQYGGYNQNGPQNDYYGNMHNQAQPHAQPGYGGNQDYYRQNQYNQAYPQNTVYQANNTGYPQNQQWPQPQQVQTQTGQPQQVQSQSVHPPITQPQQAEYKPDVKAEFKSDANAESSMNAEVKEECGNQLTTVAKPGDAGELDKDEAKGNKTDAKDEDKKIENSEQSGTKEEVDEKADKDGEIKAGEVTAGAVTKVNVKEDPGIPYDWAQELMKGYIPGCMENSAKMEIFFCILQESMALGDRILLFSQSLFTLNLIEEFLQRTELPGTSDKWARNKNYYRLDGSTSALEREKLINEYNSNPNIHLFLVSTRAGSLGINLVGANRVIVFDASWNPCHDTQAVCRVYRYGQKKPCFVYRIVMDNCLEKKIYDRQINKQGMADRVVDECNPDAHLSMKDVTNLCWDDEKDTEVKDFSTTKDKYIDVVMQKVLDAYSSHLSKEPFQHESLLIDRKEKKLSQAEKRLAKRSYELEKQANINSRPTYSYYNNGTGQGLQIRAIRTQDGMLQNKPVASVRPMQSEQMVRDIARPGGTAQGRSRWIPAEVWQRQGMTAQEMTLPLDVVIPTNSPDRGSIVLKAGQKVLVLKSPKGIYMQLECGKIVAIKTAFKVRGGKAPEKGEEANKETPAPTTILKKLPQVANTSKTTTGTVPLPLKNNSAITVIPKGGQQRVVKPFTQSVTKLNMRSIRQPVPNLVGRQIPVKMGAGPRFTGKIQSVHRKVQLAKAKPYNLDKSGDPMKALDPGSIKNEPTDREDQETHIVPSSDEEIPLDQQVDPAEKKDDDSADAIECTEAEMFSESEKSIETDLERLSSVEFPDSNQIDRRQSTDSYQSSEKHSSSDGFTNLDRFPNTERFPGAESFATASDQFQTIEKYPINTEKYQNLEKFPANSEKYSNVDKFPANSEKYQQVDKFPANSEKYQQVDKFPANTEKYQQLDKFPSNTEKYPTAEKFPTAEKYVTPERNPNVEKYPMQEKFGVPGRFGAAENFTDRYPQAEKYPGYPERFPNPVSAEKFGNEGRFTTEKFSNPTPITEKFTGSASTVERYPNPAANVERYPNTGTENFVFSATEKFTNPERFGQSDKFPISVSTVERYPNPAASVEKYPNPERFGQTEKFSNTERFGQNQQQPEKFSNPERYPQQQQQQQAEKFSNPERYPQQQPDKFPNPERFTKQQAEKFSTLERFPQQQQQQPEKFPNPERYPQQQQPEKFPSSERYPQQQQPEKFPNTERYPQQQQSEKFPNTERFPQQQQQQPEKFLNTERYPQQQQQSDKFSNPERYSQQQQPEKFANPERYPQQQQPEKFPNTERYPQQQQQPEKFPNTERYPQQQQQPEKFPNTERYPQQQQQPEKFPNTERYPQQQQQPDKFPNTERYPQQQQQLPEKFTNTERYPQQQQQLPEKFTNSERYPQQQQLPEKFANTERYPQQQPEKFPPQDRYPQPEKYGTMDKFPSQTPEKYPAMDKFPSHNPERYPAADQYQNPEKYPAPSKYPAQPTYANMENYPVVGSYQKVDTYQTLEKPKSSTTGKDGTNEKLKHNTGKDNRKDKSKHGSNSFMSTHSAHPGPNIPHSGPITHTVPNPAHTVANIAHNVSNSSYSISNISHSGPNLSHAPSLTHSAPNLSHTPLNPSHPGANLAHSGANSAHTTANVSHTVLAGANSGHLAPNSGHSANPAHNISTQSVSNPHHPVPTSIYSASNIVHSVSNPNYSVSNPNHSASISTYSVSNPSHPVSNYSASHTTHPGSNQPHSGSNLSQPGPILSHSVSNQSHVSSNMPQPGTNLPQPTVNMSQPGATIPPQPPVVVVHEQGNTNRSLKNYRHNFASQKAHNQSNFSATKSAAKASATSSALHQLEQTTSSIGENKQPFQESLDNITNSYGAVPPTAGSSTGDQKSIGPEDSHIIDLDAEKNDVEIVEKPLKASSKSSQSHTSTPTPVEPTKQAAQPVAQPANTKSDAPVQPQEYAAYNSYYGYSPHMQAYPQQPGLPPQSFYNPPESAHYAEAKSAKVDKPAVPQSSNIPATPQSRAESTATAEPAPAPSHSAGTTAAAAVAGCTANPPGFAPYGQPGMPPPPPHGAYDMMAYPQQNQYSANYPGLPYPNQPGYQPPYQPPYQPDQAAGYPPAPNMYSAFHRPDVHQYASADPYAQPHYAMRNAYAHHQYPYGSPAAAAAAAAAQGMYPPAPGAAPGYEYQYNANAFPPPPPAAFVNPYSGLPNNSPVP